MQHLSGNIAILHAVSNVVVFIVLRQNHDFAPHAGASIIFEASEKATIYYENVVLAAARSMPQTTMSFKPEPQAYFKCYMFGFLVGVRFVQCSLSAVATAVVAIATPCLLS